MAYASASDVASRVYNLINGASNFAADTEPTLNQINSFLTSGCGIIEAKLSSCGYETPVGVGTVYDWLTDLNSLYAAAQAELSKTNINISPGERTRGQVYDEMFWKQLDKLCAMDLTGLGVTSRISNATTSIYVGGTKVDDKQAWEEDTNRVNPRFSRGQIRFDGTEDPTGTTASKL